MPSSGSRLIGINEVGHVDGGSTDVSWGNTTQDGIALELTTETVELQSGQAKMLESVNLVRASMGLRFSLVTSNLTVLAQLWGIDETTHVAGDLDGGTPTDEVLTFTEGNLGTEERTLYILAPGPVGTRRVEAERCRVSDLGGVSFASNAFVLPEATWEVLNPEDGSDPMTITDAA